MLHAPCRLTSRFERVFSCSFHSRRVSVVLLSCRSRSRVYLDRPRRQRCQTVSRISPRERSRSLTERVQTRQAFYNTFRIVQSGSNLQTAERNPAHLMAKQTAVVLLLAAAALSIAAAEVTVTQLSTGFEGDRRPAGASQAALKTASASLAGHMCNQHCSHPT
jgi:hypothetical protein